MGGEFSYFVIFRHPHPLAHTGIAGLCLRVYFSLALTRHVFGRHIIGPDLSAPNLRRRFPRYSGFLHRRQIPA
ncbi:hypothetical protein SAMN04487991_3586 [Celeribacter neptunius]|uniref:Uncharacterized protein n=1 Tax=Celeribacter neptunius TaxID=588602 RepID=A0A1I3W5P1_9RHOB|nr:hypothetical protein SAMN04487991_3586 [Celeribacter neptunius]